jgi:hypothetical protein
MSLWYEIVQVYSELTDENFHPATGCITLRNDSDDFGDYIAKWEYEKPIPEGLKLGK